MIVDQKIYIAGGGGMLGEAFYRVFGDSYTLKITDIDVNQSWISFRDFRDYDSYRQDVISFRPDYLFHLGAHTSLEYCEENPEDALLTNTTSVQYAVRIANELDIPLLYISTAGIFDGLKDQYTDWDTPNPIGQYARTKYLGEKFVLEHKKDALVCRAGWMMGGGPGRDKKFVGRIMDQLKAGRTKLHVVNDKTGTPTYTVDFAQNVKLLLEKKCWGLFNMVCGGDTSRLEVAAEILAILDLRDQVELQAVSSDYFNRVYFAPRPSSEILVNARLDQQHLNIMRDWKQCLREYLLTDYKPFLENKDAAGTEASITLPA